MTGIDEAATSRTLEVDGHRVHYHDVGDGEPLVMLQAFGPMPGTTAWLTYEAVLAAFAERFRCILLDYPNFGRSSPRTFHEPVHDVYARNAFAVMDALGLDAAMVLGTSTGGTVALDMALTVPERVTRLVIGACEASTGGDPYLLAPFPSEVHRLFDDCQSHPPDRDRIRRLLTAIVHEDRIVTDGLVDTLYEWRVAEPEHAEAWARSTSVPHGNIDRLPSIDVPVLIIHGRFDRMVPLEQAVRLLGYLSRADLVVLNGCGHWPPVERPGDFAHHAVGFLTSPR